MEILRSILSGLFRRWSIWVAAVILILAGYGKWESSLMPENTYVAVPKMPKPNACDYFMAAHSLLASNLSDDLGSIRPELSRYRPTDRDILDIAGEFNANSATILPEKEKLVSRNQAAIEKFREGLKFNYVPPVPTSFDTFDDEDAPHNLARLICLDGESRATHGDYSGAMGDFLDCIEYAIKLQGNGEFVDSNLGRYSVGRMEIRHVMPNLTAQEARDSAFRLFKIDSSRASFAQAVALEETWTQLGFLNMVKQPHWRDSLFGDSNYAAESWIWENPTEKLKHIIHHFLNGLVSSKNIYNNYTAAMNDAISRVSKPWPDYKISPIRVAHPDKLSQIAGSPLNRMYALDLLNLTYDRFLEIDLALNAYKLDHNHYPVNLQNLVPTFIPKIPTDPFTYQKPLRYRLKPNGTYLLYSVGPDDIDDGGLPVRGDFPDEKGDIVDIVRLM